ncbi:hypothetical protein [Zavarzinella formosa]|uniref:hypothetical protein n=1 Tax=Zavarzinella formosa TaxID=360055 RepID=UPI0003011E32|nr:hypothetical protein [Zavarzinella formosa]
MEVTQEIVDPLAIPPLASIGFAGLPARGENFSTIILHLQTEAGEAIRYRFPAERMPGVLRALMLAAIESHPSYQPSGDSHQ